MFFFKVVLTFFFSILQKFAGMEGMEGMEGMGDDVGDDFDDTDDEGKNSMISCVHLLICFYKHKLLRLT